MAKYNSIAVLYGSDSSEWEVSCRSGEFTAARIDESLFDVYEIFARHGKWSLVAMRKRNSMRVPFPEEARPEIDKTDFSVRVLGEKVKFDFVYIMQHGSPGETGQLQGYFEMLGIPFSTCSAFVTTVAFDKYSCKSYLRGMDAGAIRFAFSECDSVIVERGITPQHELTCAVYSDGGEVRALPIIEIVTTNDYFDYDAKYNGHSEEICPAPVSAELTALVQDVSRRIYSHLGCKGLVRMDYIAAEDGLYFLEVNIIPGMTNASLVPKMVRAAGMDITAFLTTIIENA